jgi:hypothetical protein
VFFSIVEVAVQAFFFQFSLFYFFFFSVVELAVEAFFLTFLLFHFFHFSRTQSITFQTTTSFAQKRVLSTLSGTGTTAKVKVSPSSPPLLFLLYHM